MSGSQRRTATTSCAALGTTGLCVCPNGSLTLGVVANTEQQGSAHALHVHGTCTTRSSTTQRTPLVDTDCARRACRLSR